MDNDMLEQLIAEVRHVAGPRPLLPGVRDSLLDLADAAQAQLKREKAERDAERVVEVFVYAEAINYVGGDRTTWPVCASVLSALGALPGHRGLLIFRRLPEKKAKVRPWAVRRKRAWPGLLTHLICPECGFVSVLNEDQRKYPPDKCPWAACEEPWGEPRDLPSEEATDV